MKTKSYTKKINPKPIIIAAVAIVLAVAIGLGTFFTLDYIFVDTPYDSVHMPKHIRVAKYIGAELSASEVQAELDKTKDGVLDLFTKKNKVAKGPIEEGMNVTVSITAKLDGATVKDASYTSYEIADIGNHETSEDKDFFAALEQHVLTKGAFDFDNADFLNAAPNFTYTYPADYKVDKVKGKTVVHEILITAVTVTDAPEYNDELFKSHPDEIIEFLGLHVTFNSVAEFEAYMRHQIELNTLWNNIVEESKVVKYPEKFLTHYEDEYDAYYEGVMASNNITSWDNLYKELGTTKEGYLEKRTEYAEGVVKEELILYEIIQAEVIRMSSKEYKKNGAKIAVENGYDDLKDYENTLGKDLAKRTVHWEMVKEYLLSKATRVA